MKLRDRIVVALCSILLIAAAGVVILQIFGWIFPLEYLLTTVADPNGRWVAGLVSGAILLIGLILFFDSLRYSEPVEAIVHETAMGQVRTSITALENVVRKAVRQVRGVREVKPLVRPLEHGVAVLLRVILIPEVNVPEVAEQIQNNVRKYLREIVGTEVLEIKVLVDNITYDVNARVE
ncbi:MAG: alkaline shock response membrane anchor protein AmaP [Firmicutes bacterium]|nr:alkaline shock response membrane anchor protein AmaP [Bacillota bacterium]